jgi:hexosaminidase
MKHKLKKIMKYLSSTLLSMVLFYSINTYATDSLPRYFKLIPLPQKIELTPAREGVSHNSLREIYLQGAAMRPILYGSLKSMPLTNKSGKAVITLKIGADSTLPTSPEGYVLEIKDNQVIINARAQSGLFYGCQTLLQLLEDARDQQVKIPACRITDYPDIAYRAIHLDLKHHVDAVGYYYKMMDRLARIKVNAVIVEFEDKLRYRKAPEVGASDAISVEQFAAISRYAHERNIEVSPLVQGLGHASFILKHEQYKKLREDSTSDWAFSPLDSGTYDLQFSLYEDAIAATPEGKYLHVGGDEVGSLGMSDLSKKSGMKPFELQMYWLNKVSAFAKQHNRIPIFWDDMVFKLAGLYQTTHDPKMPEQEVKKIWQENKDKLDENIHLFPQNCVYMRWNYGHPAISGNFKAIDWYKSNHLNVMAATAAQTMWPMLPREHSNFQPIKEFCKITADKKLDGILCTAWDDCSPHFETFWRGLYFFSLFSWNYKDIPLDQAEAMYRQRFYGPALSNSSFEFQDLMEQSLNFWETALIEKGQRNEVSASIDLIDLPDPTKTGTWSNKYQENILGAKEAIEKYKIIKNRIEKSLRASNRNRYSLSLMNQINELQIYPAKLLLLLEKYDYASSSNQQTQMNHILEYVNSFDDIRKGFENVFSETRILTNPKDYELDSNHHHHLANATVNSDWMYLFELAMNNEILKWVSK